MKTLSLQMEIINRKRTTVEAIGEFERRFSIQLPSLYIELLLDSNGGRPALPAFPISGLSLNPLGSVNFFFGLVPDYEVYDLTQIMSFFANRVPERVIPIAGNGGVDYICLDLRNSGERIVFWDHAHFWSTGEWRESDLYFIASSFEEFLKSLRANPY